ncbi:hypothetical protein MESS2_1050030 [Mesorhizobium metallidurans STM 2683]|uniref:Uncharacterized protein n=1 Tax=Mesorhizobium metallidurans STM 2683 TaxID=1297569 RepID=M5EUR1_9HYPH|nr:hypothetical protein [Mesorhizobium metallidurans]CCV03426.1 hypothetical protein MESS2_1050030 [Mesorhizobium metallidurans STM 2683]
MFTPVTVDAFSGVGPGALTPTQHEKLYTGAMARARQERSAVPAKGMARLASMFRIERRLPGIVLLLATIIGAMAVTDGAQAEENKFKVKQGISQAVKQNSAMPQTRIRRTVSKLPSLGDKIRPKITGKLNCAVTGCKAKPPILKHRPKLHCKVFGCKPGKDHDHGNHHGHNKHGSWFWGGVTIVAADHGGCGYEFWKWKTTGWRYWRQAYQSCRGQE